MPMLVHTYTSYFREKQKDLYFIRFSFPDRELGDFFNLALYDENEIPGRAELLAWIKDNLPETEVGPIYTFHDDDGFLAAPYDGTLYVEFALGDREKFEARWETPDGKSVDDRWQSWIYPFEQYKARYDGRIPDPKEFRDA